MKTTKRTKEIRSKVAALRDAWRQVVPWGLPWCNGSGPYHQLPMCDGCVVRAYYAAERAAIDAEIARLLDPPPALSGDVYALDGDQYALVLGGAR